MGRPKLKESTPDASLQSPAISPVAASEARWQEPGRLSLLGWGVLGALILLINLPLIHNLLRGEQEANVSLPYEDHFDSPQNLKHQYFTTGGLWRVANGELFSPGVRNNPLWLKAKLPQNAVVEFDARSASPEGDIRVEIFGNGLDHLSGYELIFGGWNNSLSMIARLDENSRPLVQLKAEGRYRENSKARVETRAQAVQVGKTYHWRIERKGTVLRWSIDGAPFLEFDDPFPLRGKGHDRFGFSSLESDLYYDNLRVAISDESAPWPRPAAPTSGAPRAQPAGPFADNFDRESLGADWLATDPSTVRIERGALTLRYGHNHPVWLTRPIPPNAAIELDCWADSVEGDLKVEVWGDGHSFHTGDPQGSYTSTGYVFIFGGWHNSASALVKQQEHGNERVTRADVRVEPDRHYHWRIVRQGGEISWSIDGKPFLTLKDPSPLEGPDHQYFAFSDWESPVHFNNFRVQPL